MRAGYEYIAPPYLPGLVRLRLTSCLERGAMTLAADEMSVVASLHEVKRELSIAHQIQAGFLPEAVPVLDDWQIDSRFRPAREVSGDFFDVFELRGAATSAWWWPTCATRGCRQRCSWR